MRVSILSDDLTVAERLRAALSECDVVCPIDRVMSLDSVTTAVEGAGGQPDLLFLVLPEGDRGLVLLEDLCKHADTRIVAVGTARDPQFMLRVVHAGPDDYLDVDGDLESDVGRAVGRLKQATPARSARGQLISVFSHCGGSGCSLVASNLAVALAENGEECVLCDFNLRRGDLATLLNLKPQFSVNDVSRNLSKLDRGIFEQALSRHESGVQLLAAPPSFSDVQPMTSEGATRMVDLARSYFPYVIADLEDFFHQEQSEVLRLSDTTLFVLRLDYTALRNARRTFEYLEQNGLDPQRILVVINQHGRPRELTVDQAEDVLGRTLKHFLPYDPKVAIPSVNRGVPVITSAPKSRLARALRKIAEAATQREPVTVPH